MDGVAGTGGAVSEALKQYLADEYYQGTVQTLLGGITGAVSEIQNGSGSFSSLNKISPAVEKAIKALAEKFYDLGAGSPHGTREEAISKLTSDLMDTPFNKLGDLFAGEGNSIINSIRLGDMLLNSGAFTYETLTADKLMMSLFYGDSSAYTLDAENKKITMNAGYEQLTVRAIREGGVTGVLENIPLDVVVGATDDMMKSLLWGPNSRYELDDNGEPIYKQVRYVLEQREGDETAKMYDDTDTAYVPTVVEGTALYTITVKEKTQYLKPSETEANVYLAYADQATEKATLYKKTTIADFSQPETLLNGIELGTVMNLTPTSDEFMLRLAYGEKDVDWEVKDGVIQMREGKKATTIGDLRSDDTLNDKFNGLPITTLMEIDNSDAMMRALAYGGAYCYTYDPAQTDKDKQVVMNQVRYTYEQKDGDDKKYLYGEDGEKADLIGAPVQVTAGSDALLKIEAVLTRDKNDETKVTSSQVRYLKLTDGYYYAWKAQECSGNENKILYPKLTLGDLRENPDGLLNEIELGSVMNLDHNSDEIMLTLAYGEKGADWDYKRNASGEKIGLDIVGKPKTIGNLRENEDMTEVLNSLQLSSVMNIDNADVMMRTLAYGADYRYTYDPTQTDKDKQVVMNQVRYTYEQKDGDDKKYLYGEDGEKADLIGAPVQVTAGSDTLLKIEAVLTRDKDDETQVTSSQVRYLKLTDGYYYAWKVQECSGNENKILYKPTTLGDLRDDPQGLMNDIELGALLNLTTDDYENNKMMVALAYGEKDIDWEDDGNKGFRMLNGKKPTTIGDLKDGEMTDTLNDLPLDTIMDIDEDDAMMRSLAYGASWKHSYDETQPKGERVTLLQVEYTALNLTEKTLSNKRGIAIDNVTDLEEVLTGVYKLTLNTGKTDENDEPVLEIQYLKAGANGNYFAWKTQECESAEKNEVLYAKTTLYDLQHNSEDLMNSLEFATVMDLDESSNAILRALAFGTEGKADNNEGDYYIDTTKPKGQQIVMRPGKYYKTIDELQGDSLDETIENLPLNSIMAIDNSDGMLRSLAYGPNWKHTYDSTQPEEKQITMNDVVYVLGGDGKLYDGGNNEVKFKTGTTFDPALTEQTVVVIVREATESGTEKTETYVLKKDGGAFKAYTTDGNVAKYKETTIGDLQNDPSSILNGIELGSALGVTETSPRAMIALAYGTENVDYVIDKTKPAGQQIVPKDGKTPRTLQDLTGDNSATVIDSLAIGDMVEVTPASHPVLISLAYGELNDGYAINDMGTLSTEDDVIVPIKPPRTMADLKGENSKNVINGITLESALSINANSESMMRALAYGTKNVNYTIDDNGTPEDASDDFVEMSQVFYTYKQHAVTNAHMFFDCHDTKLVLAGAPVFEDAGEAEYYRYRAVIAVQVDETTVETKYLASHNRMTYYEFSDSTYAEDKAVLYEKATLGSLSEDSSVLLDNITLADAMDVDYETETDQMKKALAFSKDGKTAYTLGQLRDDPAQIVDNIHLDSMMDPDPDSAMIMYLLYGKEGVHYEVKKEIDLTAEEKPHATKIGETSKYVVSQKKILAVHEIDGVLHLHDEYGDPVKVDKLDANGEPIHDGEGNVLQEYVKVSAPTAEEVGMGVAYTYSIDGQHYHLHEADGKKIRIKMADEDDAKKQEVLAYYVKSEILVDETTGETEWDFLYYEHNTVNDLTGGDAEIMTHLTERLTLEEVLGTDVLESNNFLRHLTHTTITELPTAINSLTIAEVFEEDVYKTNKSGDTVLHYYILNGTTEVPLYKSPDGKFYLTKNGETYSNEVENPQRILTGTWKYLLLDTTTDAEAGETYTKPEEYKVTDITELIPNMTGNMQNATLLDLQNDGIVNFLKEGETVETSILGNAIVYEIPYVDGMTVNTKVIAPYTYRVNEETVNKTKIGQLTMKELLDYVSEILGVL